MKDRDAGTIGIKRSNEDLMERLVCVCCHDSQVGCTKRICSGKSSTNEDGQTLLHLLCQDRCCSVDDVRDAIAAFPDALQRRDVYGRSVRQARTAKSDEMSPGSSLSVLCPS